MHNVNTALEQVRLQTSKHYLAPTEHVRAKETKKRKNMEVFIQSSS